MPALLYLGPQAKHRADMSAIEAEYAKLKEK